MLKKLKLICLLALLCSCVSVRAQEKAPKQVMIAPYYAKDNSEVMLAWDYVTGKSKSWYYDNSTRKFRLSAPGYQLPEDPGLSGNVMMVPYLGNDGTEVILVWSVTTGKSVSWYYDLASKKFQRSTAQFQLPEDPGVSGTIMMQPYKGKEGSEVILVWDKATGKSVSWYYDLAEKKYLKSPSGFQLPATLGLTGEVMMRAYIAKDGSEVIYTWSTENGTSINWYYDNDKKKFMKSLPKFQLPVDTALKAPVMLHPFVAKDGSEVVWVWSVKSGKCVNWYFDDLKGKYTRATSNFQIHNTLEQCMLYPYIAPDGSEVLFTWNMETGKSIGWYYDLALKKYNVSKANFQLPENPLQN